MTLIDLFMIKNHIVSEEAYIALNPYYLGNLEDVDQASSDIVNIMEHLIEMWEDFGQDCVVDNPIYLRDME